MGRKYFGTDGVRGLVGGNVINAEFALRLGYAAGRVLTAKHEGNNRPGVLIGKDTRVSGYMLESALEAGLSAAGIDVFLAGPIPTPAVAYLTRAFRLDAGIVISASHNPYHDNGIKFFSGQGTKLPDGVEEEIEKLLDQAIGCVESEKIGRAKRIDDAAGRYIEFCKSTFPNDLNLRGLRIVVDSANGAAYHIAPPVFQELGAEVISIGSTPDGFNINKNVGALHPEVLASTVNAYRADYGIALDGDADRIQMVDAQGNIYNGDQLLYAMILERLQHGQVKGVVGTLMTNYGFEKRMKEMDIPFVRANVGDRYVMEQLQKNNWLYGGEGSGHLLCLDRHTTGDGIIAALQVLTGLVRNKVTMKEWIKDLDMYAQVMVNVPIEPGIDWKNHAGMKAAQEQAEQKLAGRGRTLIRASGTEPKLRLMVEAESEALAKECVAILAAVDLRSA
ncbi:phosphoglucosamine mutase [Pelistega ratti]|uniref:phosphoglucosamine mutase n=1 Tax=Pelistega ratti TaxID=2652177 RepID=UPI0013591C49|nr:phosphoglucosamine mutase [Pelistega ratti]